MGEFSQLSVPFSDDPSLCQVDRTLAGMVCVFLSGSLPCLTDSVAHWLRQMGWPLMEGPAHGSLSPFEHCLPCAVPTFLLTEDPLLARL